MASPYQFKNILNELNKISKDYNEFENSVNNLIQKIENIKTVSPLHITKKVEKDISEIIKNKKEEIKNEFLGSLTTIKKKFDDSRKRIELEINKEEKRVKQFNYILNQIYKMNKYFLEEDYQNVLKLYNYLEELTHFKEYPILLTLESYTRLCAERINEFEAENYHIYLAFYDLCKKIKSKKYIIYAREYLFYASWLMNKNFINGKKLEEKYEIIKMGIECFSHFDDEQKEKNKYLYNDLYEHGINLYNEITLEKYNAFEYEKVKELLMESIYFNKKDIKLDFFRDNNISAEKMFLYLVDKGEIANQDNLDKVFMDTLQIASSSNKQRYLDYWIKVYDNRGWKYLEEIIKVQNDKLDFTKEIWISFKENALKIKKIGELFFNISNNLFNYLKSIKNKINLNNFINSTTHLNKLVNFIISLKVVPEEKENIIKGQIIIDNILFGMIYKYRKKYSLYNKTIINNLNEVFKDCSIRLNKKRAKECIKYKTSNKNNPTSEVFVKLVTKQELDKNKKIFVLLAILISIIIIITLILVWIFKG